jgi:hypothetical protein
MATHLTKLCADPARSTIRISIGIAGFPSLEHVSAAARSAWCSGPRFSHRPASSCKRQVQLPMRRHTWHGSGRGATAQKQPYTAVLQVERPNCFAFASTRLGRMFATRSGRWIHRDDHRRANLVCDFPPRGRCCAVCGHEIQQPLTLPYWKARTAAICILGQLKVFFSTVALAGPVGSFGAFVARNVLHVLFLEKA